MAISNLEKFIITMDAASQSLPKNVYIDTLVMVAPSGSAGGLVVVEDEDNDPVATFPINGANYESMRYINRRISGLQTITWSNTGAGAKLYIHVRTG